MATAGSDWTDGWMRWDGWLLLKRETPAKTLEWLLTLASRRRLMGHFTSWI